MTSGATLTFRAISKTRGKVILSFSADLLSDDRIFSDDSEAETVRLIFNSADSQVDSFVIGQSYDAEEIHSLAAELELKSADKYLAAKLSRNICSVGQAKLSLRKKDFSDTAINGIIERYLRAGFLDDRRYASEYTRATLNNRPAGRMFLINALREKRIAAELAEEIVDAAFNEVDEVELAVTMLRKRWWRLSEMELESARQKGYTFLARRSISYAAGKAAFDRLLAEQEEQT